MKKEQIAELSKKTGISVKELNRLNRDRWYHGTSFEDACNIAKEGVIASYNLGAELDFGMDFYLTDTYQRAQDYVSRIPIINLDGTMTKRTGWAVVEFEFNPFHLLFIEENTYRYRCFSKHDNEFAQFIFENRVHNVYNQKPHGYDLIWGVMSDSFPDQVVLDYRNCVVSYERALELLKKPNSMRQLYIGNQKICDLLRMTDILKKEDNSYAESLYGRERTCECFDSFFQREINGGTGKAEGEGDRPQL